MGRLIDADKLIQKINSIGYVPVCVDCMTKNNIIGIIEQQPTAFDLVKVLEQLDYHSTYLGGTFDEDGYLNDDEIQCIYLDTAKGIVANGGVDNGIQYW